MLHTPPLAVLGLAFRDMISCSGILNMISANFLPPLSDFGVCGRALVQGLKLQLTRERATAKGRTDAECTVHVFAACFARLVFEGTACYLDDGNVRRSRHGLASGVPGHSFITTVVWGVIFEVVEIYEIFGALFKDNSLKGTSSSTSSPTQGTCNPNYSLLTKSRDPLSTLNSPL